ncbi:MAG: DUF998 domain-containing protein [Sporichthyaceae bacterium]
MPTASADRRTQLAWATGVAGPAAFIGAWAAGGILAEGYSPAGDTISRLAEQGAATAPLMTAGFVGFGLLMPIFARELGRSLDSVGVRVAVTISALGTLSVAAFAVTAEGGTSADSIHYASAGAAYAANVLAPLLAARHLITAHERRLSRLAAAAIAAALVGSLLTKDLTGLLQRTGLTLFDAWAIWMAWRGLRAARSARTTHAR